MYWLVNNPYTTGLFFQIVILFSNVVHNTFNIAIFLQYNVHLVNTMAADGLVP